MVDDKKTYLFKVEMSCEGCSKAITNVLNKHKGKGISDFDVNLEEKLVKIESTMDLENITEILNKTGKKITYIEPKK